MPWNLSTCQTRINATQSLSGETKNKTSSRLYNLTTLYIKLTRIHSAIFLLILILLSGEFHNFHLHARVFFEYSVWILLDNGYLFLHNFPCHFEKSLSFTLLIKYERERNVSLSLSLPLGLQIIIIKKNFSLLIPHHHNLLPQWLSL